MSELTREQIEGIRSEILDGVNESDLMPVLNQALAYLALKEENEALRKDAERYAALFMDTWNGHAGIGVFQYEQEDSGLCIGYMRLSINGTNRWLDALAATKGAKE